MTDKGFSLINLGDISQPATKLIESVSNAIGILYEPTRIRRRAKADSDAAIIKAKAKIEIKNLSDRATNRNNYIEQRRQRNIESIIEIALTQLPETVDENHVDEDWIIQFFNLSQDIGNEKMQTLWARLLAGEVAKPNSYSLRTLNLVRILSQKDAEIIEKASNYVSDGWQILFPGKIRDYLETMGLGYFELINLSALGLCSGITLIEINGMVDIHYFKKKLSIHISKEKDDDLTSNAIAGMSLTDIGKEVMSFCSPQPDYAYWNLLENYLSEEFKSSK